MSEDYSIEAEKVLLQAVELHSRGGKLVAIAEQRYDEIEKIADEFGLKHFDNAIQDQYTAARQLKLSLAIIWRDIDAKYRTAVDAGFDVYPGYDPGYYEVVRPYIEEKLEEADNLISRFDYGLARVRTAFRRARHEQTKGAWLPNLKSFESS